MRVQCPPYCSVSVCSIISDSKRAMTLPVKGMSSSLKSALRNSSATAVQDFLPEAHARESLFFRNCPTIDAETRSESYQVRIDFALVRTRDRCSFVVFSN